MKDVAGRIALAALTHSGARFSQVSGEMSCVRTGSHYVLFRFFGL
jgi:hypothetical protein